MDIEKLKKEIIDTVMDNVPSARFAAGKREIVMRCPICGDSKKHPDAKHFYIKIDFNEGEYPWFYCHRASCQAKGVFTSEFLRNHLNVIGTETNIELTRYLKSIKVSNNSKFNQGTKKDLVNPYPQISNKSLYKLRYLNNRLGINLNGNDLMKYKIVLNLYDLLDFNNIKKLTMKENITNILDEDFIGFISYNNEYVNLRNLKDRLDKRYVNYNIYDLFDNTKKFYVIPNKLDLLSEEKTEIILAEGVPDILSVFFNLRGRDLDNKIYCAVCGSGYENVIKYFIKYGFISHNISIYSDADVELDYYRKVKRNLSSYIDGDMTIYYNKLKKDFGVSLKEIDYYKTTI